MRLRRTAASLIATLGIATACAGTGVTPEVKKSVAKVPGALASAGASAAPGLGGTPPPTGAPVLSDVGAIIGKVKGPAGLLSNNGGSVIANNGSGLVANNGGGVVGAGAARFAIASVAETPYPGVEVFLAEATGTAIPSFKRATSDANGDYRIPDVTPGKVFLVVGRFTAKDGSQKVMQTVVESKPEGARADLTLASSFVTAALVDGKLPAKLDAPTFERAKAKTGENLTDADVAQLGDNAKMRARMDELTALVAELKADVDKINGKLDQIQAGIDELLKRTPPPTPAPTPTPTPTPTPKPTPPTYKTVVSACAGSFPNVYSAASDPTWGHLFGVDAQAKVVRTLSAPVPGQPGTGDQAGTLDLSADPLGTLATPRAMAFNGSTLFVVDNEPDQPLMIRKIPLNTGGATFAPALAAPISLLPLQGEGLKDLRTINALVAAPDGALFALDTSNHRIHRIAADGTVSVLAGAVTGVGIFDDYKGGFKDGKGKAALFESPSGMAIGGSGALYVADTRNHAIRRVTQAGDVTTIAGGPAREKPESGYVDGLPEESRFSSPLGIAVLAGGGPAADTVIVADSQNHRIRAIRDGMTGTYAGAGTLGTSNGPGLEAEFNTPRTVLAGAGGVIYVLSGTDIRQIQQVP